MSMQSAPSTVAPSSADAARPSGPAAPAEPPTSSTRASSWALTLALVATLGAAAAMAWVGVTVLPMEAASGYYLTDTPVAYQGTVVAAFGSLLLWTLLGVASIVLGIVSLTRRRRGQVRAVVAIVLAVLAPALALLTLLVPLALGVYGLQ